MASNDPKARTGLRTGLMSRSWARRHHLLWEAEQPGSDHQPPPAAQSVGAAAENDFGPLD
ncbi:hypothetical protein [Streptomyces griseorubiginosus]|uniref:hypothetical protein n=1 Tax=Streptomyces griseorubiginosus TaxID=67304 RepID=UPI00365CEE46